MNHFPVSTGNLQRINMAKKTKKNNNNCNLFWNEAQMFTSSLGRLMLGMKVVIFILSYVQNKQNCKKKLVRDCAEPINIQKYIFISILSYYKKNGSIKGIRVFAQ